MEMTEDKLKALRYQALQNETLKNRDFVESDGAIYKRSKSADKSTFMEGNLIPLQRGDAFWLIEEIERQRAELAQRDADNAALRAQLERLAEKVEVGNTVRFKRCDEVPVELWGTTATVVSINGNELVLRNWMMNYGVFTPQSVAWLYVPPKAAAPVETAPAPEPAPRRPRLGDTLVNAITVGSRVRIKESGEYAHVTRITHDGDKRLYVVTCEDFTGTVYALPTEDIELAKTEAPEIKVGDLVEVAKGRHRYVRGHVKEITNHRYHVAFVQIEGELTQAWVWFDADEITFLAR